MSDIHKLRYGNNYNHWKVLDLMLDLKYFSFSNPNPIANPTHLNTRAGVPNLFLTMYPFSIPTNEHVPLQHFNR